MASHGSEIEAYVETDQFGLADLTVLATHVDNIVGAEPPPEGYNLGAAISAILNGGTVEDVQSAFAMLKGWSFCPKGGWSHDRKESDE